MTINEFIEKYKLTLIVNQIPNRTDRVSWKGKPYKHKNKYTGDIELRYPSHWNCELSNGSREFTFEYSMGAVHYTEDSRNSWKKPKPIPPEINGVLECLRNDIVAFGTSFGEWCGEFGYDTDSIKAEETFKQCFNQTAKLVKLLGNSGIEDLQSIEF